MKKPLIDLDSTEHPDVGGFSLLGTGRMFGFFMRKEKGKTGLNETQEYVLMAAFLAGEIASFDQDEWSTDVSALIKKLEINGQPEGKLQWSYPTDTMTEALGLNVKQKNLVEIAMVLEANIERNAHSYVNELFKTFSLNPRNSHLH